MQPNQNLTQRILACHHSLGGVDIFFGAIQHDNRRSRLLISVCPNSNEPDEMCRVKLVGASDTGEIPTEVCCGLEVLSFEDHFTRSTVVGIG